MRSQMMNFGKLRLVLLVLVLLVLLFAWVDGGREPQRLIEQEVELPVGLPSGAGLPAKSGAAR